MTVGRAATLAALLVAVVVAIATVRQLRTGRVELGLADTAAQKSDWPLAIAHARSAAESMAPGSPWPERGWARLEAMGHDAEARGDDETALLAYGAEIELVSTRGVRRVPYAAFHTGYKQTAAAAGELVARVIVPRRERVSLYRKVGPRRAQAISKVCFAGCVERRDGRLTAVRVALGGVAPVPLLLPAVAQAIASGEPRARVLEALGGAIAPIDDVRSTSRYRRRVAGNLLAAFLDHAGLSC